MQRKSAMSQKSFSLSWKTGNSQFAAEHDVNVEPWVVAHGVIWRIKILDKIWNAEAPFVWSVICQQSGLKVEWSAASELDTWYFPEKEILESDFKEILESDFISGIKDLHSGRQQSGAWSIIWRQRSSLNFKFKPKQGQITINCKEMAQVDLFGRKGHCLLRANTFFFLPANILDLTITFQKQEMFLVQNKCNSFPPHKVTECCSVHLRGEWLLKVSDPLLSWQ